MRRAQSTLPNRLSNRFAAIRKKLGFKVEARIRFLIRISELIADLIRDFVRKNCPAVAAALSYYTLFSLFPLSLLVISIAGFVVGPSMDKEELAAKIAAVIPISTDFLTETLQGVVEARAITGLVSIVGLVWASTAALATLRKGINTLPSTWAVSF